MCLAGDGSRPVLSPASLAWCKPIKFSDTLYWQLTASPKLKDPLLDSGWFCHYSPLYVYIERTNSSIRWTDVTIESSVGYFTEGPERKDDIVKAKVCMFLSFFFFFSHSLIQGLLWWCFHWPQFLTHALNSKKVKSWPKRRSRGWEKRKNSRRRAKRKKMTRLHGTARRKRSSSVQLLQLPRPQHNPQRRKVHIV